MKQYITSSYMSNTVSDVERQAIQTVCGKEPAVAVAYLFGSRAKGTTHSHSDYDIGVVLTEEGEDAAADVRLRLITAFSQALRTDHVDIVVLNTAANVLQFEAIRHGSIVYEQSRTTRVFFEHRVMRTYLDMRLYRERYYAYKLDHIIEEGLP